MMLLCKIFFCVFLIFSFLYFVINVARFIYHLVRLIVEALYPLQYKHITYKTPDIGRKR